MKAADKFLLCQILVFGVVLPTVDTFSDLVLSGQLFVSGHILWALAVLLPVLINFLFIVVAFRQFPFAPWHHRYVSLTMLVFQVRDFLFSSLNFLLRFGPNISRWAPHMTSSLGSQTGRRSDRIT